MDFIFKPEAYYRLNDYLKRLSFYAYIDKHSVYRKIAGYIAEFNVYDMSKAELKRLVHDYLWRLSFYTDIEFRSVNKKIQEYVIDPIIVPL